MKAYTGLATNAARFNHIFNSVYWVLHGSYQSWNGQLTVTSREAIASADRREHEDVGDIWTDNLPDRC